MKPTKEDMETVVQSLAFDAEEDVVLRARKILTDHATEYVKTFPMWMRLNVCCNGTAGHSDEDIDWDKVHDILCAPSNSTDINTIDFADDLPKLKEVNSIKGLMDIRDYIIDCQIGGYNPWRRIKCKKCNEYFDLTFSEVTWYEGKGFKLPKTCKSCRTGTEKPKKEKIVPKTQVVKEEEPGKTALQIAMEKAGIKNG